MGLRVAKIRKSSCRHWSTSHWAIALQVSRLQLQLQPSQQARLDLLPPDCRSHPVARPLCVPLAPLPPPPPSPPPSRPLLLPPPTSRPLLLPLRLAAGVLVCRLW